jgi:hypothetical protein
MTDFLQLVSMLREQMSATLSRSDVLKPLAWLVGILALLLGLSLWSGAAPAWLLVTELVLVIGGTLLYGAAYIFCLLNDRDALRSEKYSLHKMALEHGFYGDDRIGLIESQPKTGKKGMALAPPTDTSSE